MSLTDRARRDIAAQSSNKNGWGVELIFLAPNNETATIAGIHTKHHLGVSEEGTIVNSKTAFVSFSEDVLKAANNNYPIRNSAGEVALKNHRVNVKDSTDTVKNYVINGWFPDEKLGYILLSLGDYKV